MRFLPIQGESNVASGDRSSVSGGKSFSASGRILKSSPPIEPRIESNKCAFSVFKDFVMKRLAVSHPYLEVRSSPRLAAY
jgi:hypothetical protein